MFRAPLAFSALISPAGVHVVSYRRRGGGLQIERYASQLRPGLRDDQAAEILGELLESQGARGRSVSLAVTGFGVCHQILTLPPANRELLMPIIVRELRRFYPDTFSGDGGPPIVDFIELESADATPTPQKELLVAALPRPFLDLVVETLSRRGIRIVHWTILPRGVQRLYEAFAGTERTAVALLMIPGWPLVGFFHDDELRLFSEPRSAPGAAADNGLEGVVEHVERGSIFLRQQFRGATVSRLFLAAPAGGHPPVAVDDLRSRLGLPTTPLGPIGEEPGALAALGAALDAAGGDGLNLLPAELRPASSAERSSRLLVIASAALLLLAGGWWAWSASRAEAAARQEVQALAERLESRRPELAAVEPVVRARQEHAQRAAIIEILARDRRRLPEVLWPLQAAEPDVTVRTLDLARLDDGWRVTLAVTATAMSYAAATDAINALAHQLGAELPEEALTMTGVVIDRTPADTTRVDPGPTPIAASVEMSFIVPALNSSTP